MSGELEPYPEAEAWDRVEDLLLAVISAVPGIGGPAQLLVERMIGPSLERRRAAFDRDVVEAVRELQRCGVDPATLPDNDAWVTAVMKAGRIALGTHLEEKMQMLKAAIVNAALPDAPADFLTMRFLGFVEDLDPEHFLLLEYGRDPVGWYDRKALSPEVAAGARTYALEKAGLGISAEWQGLVIRDLGDADLIFAEMLGGMVTSAGMHDSFITHLGTQLLDFVTLYDPTDSEGGDGQEG